MNSEKLLLILKVKQIPKYLSITDLIELSLTCHIIYKQLKLIISSNFIITTYKYEKISGSQVNLGEFENEANEHLKKNSNTINLLKIGRYPSFYKIYLNWSILTRLRNINLIGTFKLSELNILINSSNCLLVLTLFKVVISDDISNETTSVHVQLPTTLIEFNIDTFMWIMNEFNQYSISKHGEFGAYLFGSSLVLPNLNLLSIIQISRTPNNLLNFLLSKTSKLKYLEARGDNINHITYQLLNTKCSSLIGLKLKFSANIPVLMETLNAYKFATPSELFILAENIHNNVLFTYLACKCCPYLNELSLHSSSLDFRNLNQLLELLPQIRKLALISYLFSIDINDLKFFNSTIKNLSLIMLDKFNLVKLIHNVESWSLLEQISIEFSGEGPVLDMCEESKLDMSSNRWKLIFYRNSIKLFLQ